MRAIVLIVGLLALVGCSSAAEQAERRYEIVANDSAAAGERCSAARAVADAYLKEQSETKYHEAKVRTDIVCATESRRAEIEAEGAAADKIEVTAPQ